MKKLLLSASTVTVFVMVVNFIFKIYLSHHIDKENLAVFYTFMDVVGIVLMLFSGFRDSLVKAFDDGVFGKVFSWYLVTFFGGIGISLGMIGAFYRMFGIKELFTYFVLMMIINSVVIFVSYINVAHKNYKVMLFENAVTAVGLIISYFVFKAFFDGFLVLFCSFLGSYVVRFVYLIFFKNFSFACKFYRFDNDVKRFMKNSLFSSLMYFFSGLFISLSSVILLKLYHDTNVLGDFQVVVKSIFFSLVAVFVFPLNTYMFPEISKLISQREFAVLKSMELKLLKYLSLFFLLLVVGTFFTESVIALVFPPTYAQSYKMLNMMLPFLPFIAYTTFALNILKGANRFGLALIVRVMGSSVFFVVISLFYLLNFDASYIVVALDVAFVSMALLSYYYKRQIV